MSKMTDVVGYSYEAALHCVPCAEARFSSLELELGVDDDEGNAVSPVFAGSEDAQRTCEECKGTGECRCDCNKCGEKQIYHDCYPCQGDGTVPYECDECGAELS